jgi:SAM-dependent methyltransferase
MGAEVQALNLSSAVQGVLACPQCGSALEQNDRGERCAACGSEYPANENGQLDLRLKGTKKVSVDIPIGSNGARSWDAIVGRIAANPNPQIDYPSIQIPPLLVRGNRLTPELLTYFPRAKERGMMLDIGCGDEPFREICSHTNMEYVGIDYDGPARILADGHALPFKDESFDFIISFAVLEHIRHPIVALREACRVLKPGGRFIGTVAFLEPFHLNSYYHFSPLAVDNLLSVAGFKVEQIEANPQWTGLRAMGWMSLFPHAPMWFSNLMVLPLHLAHRAWWKLGHLVQHRTATSEEARRVVNSGGFRWICSKATK